MKTKKRAKDKSPYIIIVSSLLYSVESERRAKKIGNETKMLEIIFCY